jgi:hypothetical protein
MASFRSGTEGGKEEPGTAGEGPSKRLRGLSGSADRLRIICVNDVYELENLPRLATASRVEALIDGVTIGVLAGDFLAPSLLSSLDKGVGMIATLNATKALDFVCLGNHECDVPYKEMLKRIDEVSTVRHFHGSRTPYDPLSTHSLSRFPPPDGLHSRTSPGKHSHAWRWSTELDPTHRWPQHRLNSNMPALPMEGREPLPTHAVVTVGQRRVALLGLLTEDPTIYRQDDTTFRGTLILNLAETAASMKEKLLAEGIDTVVRPRPVRAHIASRGDMTPTLHPSYWCRQVPLTHQSIGRDRDLAATLGVPLLIGGHDHEPFLETIQGCTLIKVQYRPLLAHRTGRPGRSR